MSEYKLKHVKFNELPPEWLKHLPVAQTFSVTIVAENLEQQALISVKSQSSDIGQSDNIPEDREAYLQYLRESGININRLKKSIEEYKAGKAKMLYWDEF
jgi:hypothetical protein